VTVVNYGGDGTDLVSLLLHAADLPISVITVREQQWFNKSKAQNIGAAHSPHDLLFFCDCDILLNADTLDDLIARVGTDTSTFGTIAGVTETERNARGAGHVVMFGYHLKLRLANGRTLDIMDNEEDAETGTRQAPGLLLTHRSSFERLGGYNARLHGWGWEDQDMIARLTLGDGLKRIQSGSVQHISHGDDSRIRHYPPVKDRWESRDRMFRQALANYDRGDFSGTLAADLIELSGCCEATPQAT
jgi:glycosyltransferase involved in cell wall biosynthesis